MAHNYSFIDFAVWINKNKRYCIMRKKNKVIFLFAMISISLADIPLTISYQGVLTDANNTLVDDGNYKLTFNIKDGDTQLWSESHENVTIVKGLFNVILGSRNPLDLPFDNQYTLGISVNDGQEMSPLIPFTSAAYSLNARQVKGSNLFPADGDAVVSGNFEIGNNNQFPQNRGSPVSRPSNVADAWAGPLPKSQ